MLDFGQCRRDSQKGIVVEIDSSIRKFDEAEDGTQKNGVKYRFVIDNAIGGWGRFSFHIRLISSEASPQTDEPCCDAKT